MASLTVVANRIPENDVINNSLIGGIIHSQLNDQSRKYRIE